MRWKCGHQFNVRWFLCSAMSLNATSKAKNRHVFILSVVSVCGVCAECVWRQKLLYWFSCFFFLLFGSLETVDNVESFPPHFVHSFAFYMMIHFISQIKGDCRCARVSFWDGFSLAFAQLQLFIPIDTMFISHIFFLPRLYRCAQR